MEFRTEIDSSHTDPRFGRFAALFVAAALPVLALWTAIYLAWPFGQDQSAFAWVSGVILRGGLPYGDAWEVKGPLAYYLVAIPTALFGSNFWGIRLFDLLVVAVGLRPVYRLAREAAPRAAAWLAVTLFLLWYAALNHENTAQPDGWAGVLLAGAAAALLGSRSRPGSGAAFVAGVLIGACTLLKPTYLLFLALPGAYALVRGRGDAGWLARFLVATLLGFALPVVAAVVWFAVHGALDDWYQVQWVWLARVYTGLGLPWTARINQTLGLFTTGPFALALPFALAGLGAIHRRDRAAAALFVAWVVLPVLTVLLQGKPWPYLWLPLYPPLAVLAAVGAHRLLRFALPSPGYRRDLEVARVFAFVAAALLAVGALLAPLDRVLGGLALLRGGDAAAAHDAAEFGRYGRGPESLMSVAADIRERSAPGDPVLVWGMSGTINYLSGRAAPTRFGVKLPLVAGAGHPVRAAYRAEFLADLVARPPAYVVLDLQDCAAGREELEDFPEFAALLARDYRVEREFTYDTGGIDGCLTVLAAR